MERFEVGQKVRILTEKELTKIGKKDRYGDIVPPKNVTKNALVMLSGYMTEILCNKIVTIKWIESTGNIAINYTEGRVYYVSPWMCELVEEVTE